MARLRAQDQAEDAQSRIHMIPRVSLPSTTRLVDEFECVLSVLLAIMIAHLIGARNISWAAFSGYMVMRGHIAETLLRGGLRVLGTALGAGLALVIVPAVEMSWPLSSLAGALFGGITLYGALTGRRAYAWLFTGLTFEMILLDQLEHPGYAASAFAATWLVEIVAGTSACVIVSIVSALTVRRRWPAIRTSLPRRIGWHPHALRHAARGAVALAFLPLVGAISGIHELAQGAASIMAVMLVPVSSLGASGLIPVSRKLAQRIVGCLAGAALAAPVLLLAQGSPAMLILGTAAGIMIGRHVENGRHAHVYVGTQFTLAILVILVPDSYTAAAIAPALDRLYGILVGMALLEPVMLIWHIVGAVKDSPGAGDRVSDSLSERPSGTDSA